MFSLRICSLTGHPEVNNGVFLDLIRVNKDLRRVLFRQCDLSDEACVALAGALKEHPSVRRLDVSGNPSLQHTAGRALQVCPLWSAAFVKSRKPQSRLHHIGPTPSPSFGVCRSSRPDYAQHIICWICTTPVDTTFPPVEDHDLT